MIEPISHLELQAQPPFLLYKNERSKIRGFWFYNTSDCSKIANLVQNILNNFNCYSSCTRPLAVDTERLDILSVLGNSQKKTSGNNHLTTKSKFSAAFCKINNPSVKNFFAAIPADASGLHRVATNRVASGFTVNEIEKLQQTYNLNDISDDRLNTVSPIIHCKTSPLLSFFNSVHVNSSDPKNEVDILSLNSISSSCLKNQIDKSNRDENIYAKPALMPPTMFKTTERLEKGHPSNTNLLTKEQIMEALIFLLKNDLNFHDKLYDAYIQSTLTSKQQQNENKKE